MEFIDIVLQLQLSNAENRRGRQTDRQTLRQTRRRTNTRFSERRTESIQISHAVTRHVALAISQLGADIARVWHVLCQRGFHAVIAACVDHVRDHA